MNINLKTLTHNLLTKIDHKPKDTVVEIVNAIAMAELEETISIMCCDSE